MDKSLQGYDEERYDLLHTEQKEKRRKIILRLLFWIISIPLAIAAGIILCSVMIDKTRISNTAMEPTLSKSDSVIINTLSYKLHDPERFDVIVFKHGDLDHSVYEARRIYGLPGETIKINDGNIYINDRLIEDKIDVESCVLSGIAMDGYKLSDSEYFVLADDRNNAEDSRYQGFGTVKRSSIIGKAWIRTNKFGFIDSFSRKQQKG